MTTTRRDVLRLLGSSALAPAILSVPFAGMGSIAVALFSHREKVARRGG